MTLNHPTDNLQTMKLVKMLRDKGCCKMGVVYSQPDEVAYSLVEKGFAEYVSEMMPIEPEFAEPSIPEEQPEKSSKRKSGRRKKR